VGACRATAGASIDNDGPREGDTSGENATADMQRVSTVTSTSEDAGGGPASEDAARTSVDAGDGGLAGDDAARTVHNGCLECKRRYEVYCWHR
jgi:hypothetical protein